VFKRLKLSHDLMSEANGFETCFKKMWEQRAKHSYIALQAHRGVSS